MNRQQSTPQDWQVKTLAELGGQVTSGSRGWAVYYANHGSLFVRITNLKRGNIHLDLSSPRFVQIDPGDAEARRTRLAPGDLLVSITADIGIIGYIDDQVPKPAYINQHIARVRLDPARADSRFVSYYLASWEPQRRFVGSTDTGAKAGMNLATVAGLSTVVPPLAEQSRIADALMDVDKHISTLERLIFKKQAIKQGVMQKLLTGGMRLPGFVDDWIGSKIGDLLEFKNGLNKGSEYFGVGTPIVNFMDVMSGPIITVDKVRGRVTLTRDEVKRFSARRGDIFFTRTSETVEEIGTAAVLVDDIPRASFSGFILRGRPRTTGVDPRFVAYAFQLGAVREQVMSTATYTTRALTNGRSLSRVTIELPPVDEQAAIAKVIADMDAELAGLVRRHKKAHDIKIGVLQQLLTGRARLPFNEDAA